MNPLASVTANDWAGLVLAIFSTLAIVVGGLRYLVRGWLWTLTPNGGSSLADRLARIETRQEQMMELLKK
jgi:hypothetical protein